MNFTIKLVYLYIKFTPIRKLTLLIWKPMLLSEEPISGSLGNRCGFLGYHNYTYTILKELYLIGSRLNNFINIMGDNDRYIPDWAIPIKPNNYPGKAPW